MKKIITFNFIAMLIIGLLGISAVAQENKSPTLLKRTVQISVKRNTRWWKNPSAAEPVYDTSDFFLDKNPGEYEIKFLRDSTLARSLKFTVGKDGKIVDNGIKDKNQLGGVRMIFPVSVVGAADGKWNMNAWKTDGLYGNLVGFTAIQ